MEVTCSASDAVNKGSSEVTCKTGTDFTFSEEPSCSVLGKYHNHHLNTGTSCSINRLHRWLTKFYPEESEITNQDPSFTVISSSTSG